MHKRTLAALFAALGVVLPLVFHVLRIGGPVLLPMHLPVLLGGLALGPAWGAAIGLVTPLLNFLLTGMPPLHPPILPLMLCELITYGAVAGWLRRWSRPGLWGSLLPLVGAMVAGRLVLGIAAGVAHLAFGFAPAPLAYVGGALLTGLPGLAAQLVLVPLLLQRLPRLLAHAEVPEA